MRQTVHTRKPLFRASVNGESNAANLDIYRACFPARREQKLTGKTAALGTSGGCKSAKPKTRHLVSAESPGCRG